MRNTHLFMATAVAIVVASAAPAFAKTIVVKQNGAVSTIQEAVDMADDGDKIIINRGAYYENVTATQNNLKFIGRRAIWDGNIAGSDGTCLTLEGDGCTVQGITFRNGNDQLVIDGDDAIVRSCRFRGSDADGIDVNGDDALIDRCRFEGTDGYSIIFDSGGEGGRAVRCTISHANDAGIYADDHDGVTLDRCNISFIDGYGIEINGSDDATVTRCRVRSVDDDGIYVDNSDDGTISGVTTHNTYSCGIEVDSSDDFTIEKCRLTGSREDDLINSDGDRFTIRNNRMSGSYEEGIQHSGNDATIENNVIFDIVYDGIDLRGDNAVIRNNRINESGGEGGIELFGDGATIENNVIRDTVEYGVYVNGNGGDLTNNSVFNCGDGRGEAGFEIRGNSTRITNCRVTNSYGDGFYIRGSFNTLTNCRVVTAIADGFDINATGDEDEDSTGNTLDRCFATNCDGEALDNSGMDTNVTNCTFRSSRILLGNDGTFDTFTGNNVDLDDAVAPEVD